MARDDSAEPRGALGQIARIRERANLLVERELAARGIEGVVPAHGAVFACLFQAGEPVPIKEVVAHVGRVKSTVTGVLKRLERGGYLRRETSDADRRVQLISLTAKGWALRPDFEAISETLQRRLYGTMADEDRRELAALLQRLERNLSAEADEVGS